MTTVTMTETIIKRVGPGCYTVEHKLNEQECYTVLITRHDNLNGWIAAAQWDRYLCTDPVSTLREAKEEALEMIYGTIHEQRKRIATDERASHARMLARRLIAED